jgi:hypothetical protein
MSEEVLGIGYLNADKAHLIVTVKEPTLWNANGKRSVQIVLTIESARELDRQLNEFLRNHGPAA